MNKKKYILVLDLDETLFHTSGNNLYIRPGCVDFIKSLYETHFPPAASTLILAVSLKL